MSAREDLRNRLGRGLHEMSVQWRGIDQMLDAYKAEVQNEDAATLMWRIREALVYMSQVSQPNEHTLSHIRRYLRGENDGMPAMSDGSELDKK